jgi:hypothetical protein
MCAMVRTVHQNSKATNAHKIISVKTSDYFSDLYFTGQWQSLGVLCGHPALDKLQDLWRQGHLPNTCFLLHYLDQVSLHYFGSNMTNINLGLGVERHQKGWGRFPTFGFPLLIPTNQTQQNHKTQNPT